LLSDKVLEEDESPEDADNWDCEYHPNEVDREEDDTAPLDALTFIIYY
jgi:hypothetical protein